ncbi:uS8 family ribosomal protein [Candidatus Absconditicoccus praedator]|uniref:uS8 family ribosomal protein n=1 Tax=Candidatus Absconditicoccus praedator TaxID=2735562 RepID=UPI001E38ED28|nr:30S ribosomal protein S8 [Candidatus Absconditicoccus praedator]UFX82775.1 30S ribosomal protein S8 [Candidatus Absconditicoccus praedator]
MNIVNSPVHDLLIRIKNAYMARKKSIKGVIYSKMKENILKLLKENNFVEDYKVVEDGKKAFIEITLFEVKDPVKDIPVVKFHSKPSRRWYVSVDMIGKVAGGKGIGILSTSKGILTNNQAKEMNVGGELIAEIY